jgi:hypothetical protein
MSRVEHDDTNVAGLREHLTKQARDLVVRLEAAHPGYGFGAEVRRLRQRLDDLLDGNNVLVYTFEVPADMQPPRDDGQHVYTLRGDRLVPAEYEVSPVLALMSDDTNGATGANAPVAPLVSSLISARTGDTSYSR